MNWGILCCRAICRTCESVCVCVHDVIQMLGPGCLSGQTGGCCGPWENSSWEQVNVSQRPVPAALSFPHVLFSHLARAKTLWGKSSFLKNLPTVTQRKKSSWFLFRDTAYNCCFFLYHFEKCNWNFCLELIKYLEFWSLISDQLKLARFLTFISLN